MKRTFILSISAALIATLSWAQTGTSASGNTSGKSADAAFNEKQAEAKAGKKQLPIEFGGQIPVVKIQPVDEARVKEIAPMLTPEPKGLGENYHNRKAWDKLKSQIPQYKYVRLIREADGYLTKTFPVWDNPRYMRMFTDNDSQSGKDLLSERFKWLPVLVWAECFENNGNYMPTIEMVIDSLMAQETWVYPRNYRKETAGGTVELNTSRFASNIAQALYLLDDKFSPEYRKKVLDQLYTRAFNPVMRTINGEDTGQRWWIEAQNNWNSVCLAGVVGAALSAIPDPMERAKFVAIGERYIANFVGGYGLDGYCAEGMGYYAYGFVNYMNLRECIMEATKGKLDIFAQNPRLEIMTLYPLNIEITPKVYPTIADCDPNPKVPPSVLGYMSKVLGLGLEYEKSTQAGNFTDLTRIMYDAFPGYGVRMSGEPKFVMDPLRHYFKESGLLIERNTPGAPLMGAALKGGDNNESHNHNDLGSYTLVVVDQPMVEDPGLIAYTADMSWKRYSYKTLSSYGHPVPFIGGKEQAVGKQAKAVIIKDEFTPAVDEFSMDISSAYADSVPGLKKMTRSFVFTRGKAPWLSVTDDFAFSSPQSFETAIITRGEWKQTGLNKLEITRGEQKISATVNAGGAPVSFKGEWIDEDGGKRGKPYNRIAIKLDKPATEGKVTITYAIAK